ncbi:hypothetical protein [Kitasatospora sp. NBC_01300]|uniref:hypothetical protein n=1 Tax=Kitasatospora sp. NBC_01300 TaxID=2903574 RepID=UPI002F9167CC|nr:hypothetical protein OG556_40810 [Kitasatospora sp. NBC_01300]
MPMEAPAAAGPTVAVARPHPHPSGMQAAEVHPNNGAAVGIVGKRSPEIGIPLADVPEDDETDDVPEDR